VLISRDMDGGGVLKDALKKSGAELLKSAGAVYVADVHRMPVIRRLFALPGLRRRGYPVLIDEDGTATESFPSAEGKATLIELERLRIKRIRHLSTAPELRRAL
ncbi:MAG: FAD/FMN-containing dehydrogenase, partial [Myxococcota bacterium]